MLLKTCLAAAAVALAGCSSTSYSAHQATGVNNYPAAEALWKQAIQEGDSLPESWNNLGIVYRRTGRMAQAIDAYTMAARYGSPVAQNNLRELGQPVPPVDLIARSSSGISGAEALLYLTNSAIQGRNAGLAAAAERPRAPAAVNCTSTTYGRNTETTCR